MKRNGSRNAVGRPLHVYIFELSECDLHWLAGWLEGEGCFRTQRRVSKAGDEYFYPSIQGVTTDKDVAERAAKLMQARKPIARSSPSHAGWKPCYTVRVQGWGIVPLAELLLPLMGRRRKQAIRRMLTSKRKTRT